MENAEIKKKIADLLRGAGKIAITAHVRPDADCIGSGLALFLMLRQLGKDVHFLHTDPPPFPLTELPGFTNIRYQQIYPEAFDVVVLLEGSTEERTGQKNLKDYFSVNIDHHVTGTNNADINWIRPKAAAVGEMVYEIGVEMGTEFTRDIAFNLYAAIASDTGSFKYSNTTYKSLYIASELIRKSNISPSDVSNLLFYSNPREKVEMTQRVLSTMELDHDGKICIIRFEKGFLRNLTLKEIETEDIISIARSIIGVQVTLFFKEIGPNYFRVSMRSKGNISSQAVAKVFSGGGHDHASGFFFKGSYAQARLRVLEIVKQQFS